MDNGFLEYSWNPSPPAPLGSERWKDDMAFNYALKQFPDGFPKANIIVAVPSMGDYSIGYFCLQWKPGGWNYFRANRLMSEDCADIARSSGAWAMAAPP